jgi:hypothetical protein
MSGSSSGILAGPLAMGDGRPMRIAQEMPESNPVRKHRVGGLASCAPI